MSENTKALFIVGMIILIIGITFTYYSFNQYQVSQDRINNAEVTEGEILNNNIDKELDSNDDNNLYEYIFTVEYTYTINNKVYNSQKVTPVSDKYKSDNEIGVERYKDDYSEGDNIDIYYMPSDPSISYLEKSSSGTIVNILIGIMFTIAGFISVVGRKQLAPLMEKY